MLTSVDNGASAYSAGRQSSRLPQRNSKLPKNRTGVFVEKQNVHQNIRHRSIPPLARPRGLPVTDYTKGYSRPYGQTSMRQKRNDDKLLILSSATLVSLYCHLPPLPPACLPLSPALFLRVPNVYPKQKQVIQNIRARQEWTGGFFPQPIKKSRSKPHADRRDARPSPHLLQGLPEYKDLTRRSARNFVAASNNGVTHLEDLRSESISSFSIQSGTESIYDDVSSIGGLEEVYKKIIKEEASSQYSNKERKGRSKTDKKQSPLLIRSFRNPQNPHPVVQYSDIRHSNSSSKDHTASRPPVPAPYFYNSRTLPRAADHGGSRVHLSRLSGSRSSDHILAAPGAGVLTKSALGFTREHSPPSGIEGQRPPALSARGRITDSDERIGMMGRFRVPSTTPATSTPDLQKALEEEAAVCNSDHPVMLPDCEDEIDSQSIAKSLRECLDDHLEDSKDMPSFPAGIVLSLETDEGISKVIDLDEEEERNKRDVIEYHAVQRALQGITDEATTTEEEKQDNCKEANQTDSSDEVPGELNQLLQEHSEIVSQIHQLQKLTCSDDEDAG